MTPECKCGCPADAKYSHVEQPINAEETITTDTFVRVDNCSYCGFSGLLPT